jgi:protein gp37
LPNKTAIGWCDLTSNPLYVVRKGGGKRGWFCTKVSPGCAHCYAEALNRRWGNQLKYLPQNEALVEWRLNGRELYALIHRKRPARIFLGSMIDVFHPGIPFALMLEVFMTIAIAQQHTFLLLTKRPGEARAFLLRLKPVFAEEMWPLPNLWLGVSCENQVFADRRIPILMGTPAAVRFVSWEPLLGEIDARQWLPNHDAASERLGECLGCNWPHLDWGIVGGESGPKFRPMEDAWARSLVRQHRAAGVSVFYKQGAHRYPGRDRALDGETYEEFPPAPPEPVGIFGSEGEQDDG